jgi:LysM repeat protein
MSTMTIDQMLSPSLGHGKPAVRPHGSVRLTRRGRAVVVLVALLAVLAVGLVVASSSVATGEGGTAEPTRVVQVSPGDTLWDIAATVAGDGDVRAMVAQISKLNALDSGLVVAGQRLLVPVD